jgi:hypothetical protein
VAVAGPLVRGLRLVYLVAPNAVWRSSGPRQPLPFTYRHRTKVRLWKGPEKYVATVPQVFDLWQDPQERYDIFMNKYTERTWTLVTISEAIKALMATYVTHPPRKLQSES